MAEQGCAGVVSPGEGNGEGEFELFKPVVTFGLESAIGSALMSARGLNSCLVGSGWLARTRRIPWDCAGSGTCVRSGESHDSLSYHFDTQTARTRRSIDVAVRPDQGSGSNLSALFIQPDRSTVGDAHLKPLGLKKRRP